MKEARLDMRMDQSKGMCAEDVVNSLPEKELADVIYQFGEEGRSRKIARFIVKARRRKRIETTLELADVIQKAHGRRSKIHPATKTFQALRIYVNDELAHIDQFLEDSMTALKSEGRLCVMAYHSLEDRRVKQTFRTWAKEGKVALLTRKAILASREEIKRNKRSRSVRLRVCEALNKSSDLG
jgi:16S rRNA (cytosine1402-N4)-methyltransferase